MEIIRAKPDEAELLTNIAFAAKRHWGYPESWIESWRAALTIQPDFIASHETFAARLDDSAVGFYALNQLPHRVKLLHLWVLPKAMKRGIGRALFLHSIERARELGVPQLEVESDPNAEGFYQHLGARRIGKNITNLDGQQRELPILIYEILP